MIIGPVETLARLVLQSDLYSGNKYVRDAVDNVIGDPKFDAAPELYEALVEAISELEQCEAELTGEGYNNPKFNAILAKARGEV